MANRWDQVRPCGSQRKGQSPRSCWKPAYLDGRCGAEDLFLAPAALLITDKYNNEHNIRPVTAPVLVLHGELDAVIPVEMGWRVYHAAKEPKRIELFPRGAHSDLYDHGAWEMTRALWIRWAVGHIRSGK